MEIWMSVLYIQYTYLFSSLSALRIFYKDKFCLEPNYIQYIEHIIIMQRSNELKLTWLEDQNQTQLYFMNFLLQRFDIRKEQFFR